MARDIENQEAGPSILDRLIDDDPASKADPVVSVEQSRRMVREGVQRDISNLLGTRSWFGTWPREWNLLKTSVINYGLPDVTGVAIGSEEVQDVLRATIQASLQTFEPRLSGTRVLVVAAQGSRRATLVIQGAVRGDLGPVMFGGALGGSTLYDLKKGRT